MRTRDSNQNDQQRSPTQAGNAPPSAGSPGNEDVRQRALRLLELGDETIDQVLSQSAERFLAQNQQQGGQ